MSYIYIYMEHLFLMFLDHTQRRSTVGRTPLDEWSARRRDLYLTTHDTHNRQISMPPVGFEPTISAGERPAAARLLRSPIPVDYISQDMWMFPSWGWEVRNSIIMMIIINTLLLLLLLLLTAVELSLGDSNSYTSTNKTNENKYT